MGLEQKGAILMAVFGSDSCFGCLALFTCKKIGTGLQEADLEYRDAHRDAFIDLRQRMPVKKNGFLNLKAPLISTKVFG